MQHGMIPEANNGFIFKKSNVSFLSASSDNSTRDREKEESFLYHA